MYSFLCVRHNTYLFSRQIQKYSSKMIDISTSCSCDLFMADDFVFDRKDSIFKIQWIDTLITLLVSEIKENRFYSKFKPNLIDLPFDLIPQQDNDSVSQRLMTVHNLIVVDKLKISKEIHIRFTRIKTWHQNNLILVKYSCLACKIWNYETNQARSIDLDILVHLKLFKRYPLKPTNLSYNFKIWKFAMCFISDC